MNKYLLLFLVLSGISFITAQNLSNVPGKVVYWRKSPSTFLGFPLSPNRIYTASPSIVKLDNGDYLLSFNLFGSDMSPGADVSGTTYIYKSSDKGYTWSALTIPPMSEMKRGSLFVKDGVVYLWGFKAAPGIILIRKSEDNGQSWSAATELTTDTRGGTPFNPVPTKDDKGIERVWFAVGGKRLMSGKSDESSIMLSNSWTKVGNNANSDTQPDFGSGVNVEVISEAQIVHAPHTGLVLMPKVEMKGVRAPYFSHTVLLRKSPDSNNRLLDANLDDWVALPGAEKKFAASYDSVSGKFYVLSNPVLPADENNSKWTWQLIRNTAAILSSRDLYHWDVEKLFLHSRNIDYEGFQYFNFDYDGDDMIVVSRTAFDISEEPGASNKPPRGHDSNMITYHTIENFRELSPNFFLTYNENKILRHEQTQHAAAPLGSFVNGVAFDGTTLGAINGLAQDVDGDVYISEENGRILRFDALGNFKETGSGSPVPLKQTDKLFISPPAYGERSYIKSGSGNWADLSNWFYWGRPDTDYEIANLGSAITSNSTLTIDKLYSMKGIRFRSTLEYTLAGSGKIRLKSGSGNGIIDVYKGKHSISIPVVFESNTVAYIANHGMLSFKAPVYLNGCELYLKGSGQFEINNKFIMEGGTLVVDGQSAIFFTSSVVSELNGKLSFRPASHINIGKDTVFQFIKGVESLKGVFSEIILPVLNEGLKWDLSALYTDGKVSIKTVEETSVEEFNSNTNNRLRVYPNPFSDELNIEVIGDRNRYDFFIFNINGQLASKGEIFGNITLKTNNLSAGVYLIKVVYEESIEYNKINKD
jgi:hypothetical protein